MKIGKILSSLDNSWERDVILLKIKKGFSTDEIVNEFFIKNEEKIKELNSLLRSEDSVFLNHVEQLSICEAKLINKINDADYLKNIEKNSKINERKITLNKRANKISLLMINWSNKFVVIALLTISALALSKQAWA